MADDDSQLGGEGSFEERFDRLTDDDGKPIKDKKIRGDAAKEEQKETARQRRQRRLQAKRKKKEDERKNVGEYWYKDPNIAVKVSDGSYQDLTKALFENRSKLEELKRYYCRSRRRQHPIITEAYMQEIKRHVLAIEGIKDILAAKAQEYRVFYTDREHPLEACDRIVLDCFVATCIYGSEAPETNILRIYRDQCLSNSSLGKHCIRFYYAFLGPSLTSVLQRSLTLQKITRFALDRFIKRIARSLR